MYLKSIVLKGFKSFPERTRLEFGPGVSVIVGPNGSGKSNVTDAVLWALGEQSPLAVRGQSMQDVIFAGAPGRQAARGAEVELVLDDSEGQLGLGAPEVSIVRRLDRAGEGEYRLAGARCRLVDVIEVLSDTGLGKEMHSVISQGRVESIVTSKPRDRRMLIEEAAGLGKHRKRRRRAQLKLARTQDNLDRALDVEREARSRLRPLKRQAEAAELHARLERQTLEARWELVRDDLRMHRADHGRRGPPPRKPRKRRKELEQALDEVAARRDAAEEALASRERPPRGALAPLLPGPIRRRARGLPRRFRARRRARRRAAPDARPRPSWPSCGRAAETDRPDAGVQNRIAELEQELARLDRDREAELARQLAELEQQLAAAAGRDPEQAGRSSATAAAREQARERLEGVRRQLREAERAVEAARREAARVGGELAAVQPVPAHPDRRPRRRGRAGRRARGRPGLRAGGRRRARRAPAGRGRSTTGRPPRPCSTAPAPTAGARSCSTPTQNPNRAAGQPAAAAGAQRLADHVHGPAHTAAVARAAAARHLGRGRSRATPGRVRAASPSPAPGACGRWPRASCARRRRWGRSGSWPSATAARR